MSYYDEEYFRTLYGDVPKQSRFDRARDDRVVRLVDRYAPRPRPDGALLDIGCGYGYLLGRFRGRYRLAGIDVAPQATKQTLVQLPGADIAQADVQDGLPFRRPFDVILAINVIEHLPNPSSAVRAIGEALIPGGLCVIHLPTINGPVSRLIYRFAYAGDPTHVYRPSGREVRSLFESEGFERLEESYAPHTPWLGSALRWHPAYLGAFRATGTG